MKNLGDRSFITKEEPRYRSYSIFYSIIWDES